MKRLITLALLMFTIQNIKAQFIEKIFLKDSVTIYTGWIVEQVPQDYIKILRLKEKDTIRVQSENIWKIIRVIDTKKYHSPFKNRTGRSAGILLEGLGNGILYSLNYDTRFKKSKRDGWGMQAGVGFFSINARDTLSQLEGKIAFTSIPVLINYLIGGKRSALELGLGSTLLIAKIRKLTGSGFSTLDPGNNLLGEPLRAYNLLLTSVVGYRYTSIRNGLMFKTGFTPFVGFGGLNFYMGLSIGYHFQKSKT